MELFFATYHAEKTRKTLRMPREIFFRLVLLFFSKPDKILIKSFTQEVNVSQSYETLRLNTRRSSISILKHGVVNLLGAIKDEISSRGFQFVEVFIDRDEKKIKFVFSRHQKPWSRVLSYRRLGQCSFSSANLLKFAGCDASKTKKIPVEWNGKENCIEFSYAEYLANEKTHQENEA